MEKRVVLLTATIIPPEGAATTLARMDPEARKNDYKSAFSYYLAMLRKGEINGIVFCDNSASDLRFLEDLLSSQIERDSVELLSFFGLDYPPLYSRAYGEFKLLDYAMEHSRLVRELPDDGMVWKVTGRYVVRNLRKVIKTRPRKSNLYVHCRTIPKLWAEMFVMAWNKRAYAEIMRHRYKDFGEATLNGVSGETIFFEALAKGGFSSRVVRRFKAVPELEGIRGWDGQRYESMRLKIWVRRIANRLLPWLWI